MIEVGITDITRTLGHCPGRQAAQAGFHEFTDLLVNLFLATTIFEFPTISRIDVKLSRSLSTGDDDRLRRLELLLRRQLDQHVKVQQRQRLTMTVV